MLNCQGLAETQINLVDGLIGIGTDQDASRMIVIEIFERGCAPSNRANPMPPMIRIDTS
jgi:hypothetical protein